MTQDDVIEMARQAGVRDDERIFEFSQYKYLERFVNLVAAKERETCAYWKEHAQGLQRDYDSLLADFQAQRTWVGLTDAEVSHLADSEWEEAFVRLIEAKLKEKNT